MTRHTRDNPADIPSNLPAVRAAKRGRTPSRVQRRLIEPYDDSEAARELAFQHTVFCQTSLPYRDPGDEVREWQRTNGDISLQIQAGSIIDPATRQFVEVGLPWGTKPRLILAHLNAEALQRGSPRIEVEGSLSAFVRRVRGFDSGREIRMFKDQLARLSAASVRLALVREGRATQLNSQIVAGIGLWPETDEWQHASWPSVIVLSPDYFASLQAHAVPLYENDLAALAHSTLALDLYAWLAQRLHRIAPARPAFIAWAALKQQFGPDYGRMDHFKAKFRDALRQVRVRYDRARFELDDRGITLHHSPPPVTRRQVLLPRKPNPEPPDDL